MERVKVISALLALLVVSGTALGQSEAPQGKRDRQARQRVKRDTDGDGKLSRSEWSRKPEVFDRLDSDKDGFLTRDELRAGRSKRSSQRLERRAQKLDRNNDGTITRDEWPGQSERFDRLDRNHDGVVTRDEIGKRRGIRRRSGDGR